MITILNLALPFYGIILAGFAAAKVFRLPEAGLAWLNILIVYFALPAMIFLTVAAAPFEKLIEWPFVLATTLATYLVFIIPFIFSVFILKTRITTAAIHGTSASFGNVGYMGLPLAVAFFGTEAAVPAALIFCFDCALQFTLTPLLATLGHSEEAKSRSMAEVWGRVAKSIFTHPFIIATILGVIASALQFVLSGMLDGFLQMLARAAGPSALFCLGVTLGMRRLAGMGAEFPLIVVMKILVHPALVFGLLMLMGWNDRLWLHVALMMAALPTATNAFVLASQYDRYIEGASNCILVTTVLSALTLPALVYCAQHGLFGL
jgi:predicted permease